MLNFIFIKNLIKTRNLMFIIDKFFAKLSTKNKIETQKWISSNLTNLNDYCNSIDPDLWKESQRLAEKLENHSHKILSNIKYDLGGGGCYSLIYFYTRLLKPSVVIETGVAAGWSSYSFLKAMEINKKGSLYSSDYPYLKIPNPKSFIGILVPNELKKRWNVLIEGDKKNIPKILENLDKIDIFHYDSDKSYSGRNFTYNMIKGKFSDKSILIMDDIQDNSFFMEMVKKEEINSFKIFEFKGKYLGIVNF